MPFPIHRPRRLREPARVRKLARETRLDPAELIEPFFVVDARRARREIPSLPGRHQLGFEELVRECAAAQEAGIGAAILFGIPRRKDALGAGAYARDGVV
ncbi:MAG: porphobilinogen synthase, partial [Thermoanaerobaculia bacterium]